MSFYERKVGSIKLTAWHLILASHDKEMRHAAAENTHKSSRSADATEKICSKLQNVSESHVSMHPGRHTGIGMQSSFGLKKRLGKDAGMGMLIGHMSAGIIILQCVVMSNECTYADSVVLTCSGIYRDAKGVNAQ
jgi:hypothetical protein